MVACPACGTPVPPDVAACPGCQLSATLFSAVTEAAGGPGTADPTYLRTIAELISTVDLEAPPEPPPNPAQALLSRPARFPSLAAAQAADAAPARTAETVAPIEGLPMLPPAADADATVRRVEEYFVLGRRLGLDFSEFEERFEAARSPTDATSVEALSREMFVHLASVLSEEYESELARRNELAQLIPTPSADVEFDAARRALASGDVAGAQRRLSRLRDTLTSVEEEWAAGRILLTECDLLAQAARDLGIDPGPALGPFEEGRRRFADAHRPEAERLLARAAIALWTVLEPRFFEEIKRLRDGLIQIRSGGGEIAPALADLKEISTELRQRNFAGMLLAFQRLRAFVGRNAPASVPAPEPGELAAPVRPTSASD